MYQTLPTDQSLASLAIIINPCQIDNPWKVVDTCRFGNMQKSAF